MKYPFGFPEHFLIGLYSVLLILLTLTADFLRTLESPLFIVFAIFYVLLSLFISLIMTYICHMSFYAIRNSIKKKSSERVDINENRYI